MKKYDFLIVGSGLFGAVFAHEMHKIGKKCLIIEKREQWLFDILFTLEKRIDLSEYDDYNKRVFGFLSERLFTVWPDYNREKYKVYYLDLTFYNT